MIYFVHIHKIKYLVTTKLHPSMRTLYILIFILWANMSYAQITKDSLTEIQSLLDSIPDISLAELGIDTTAEIVPDTLHLVIPAPIESDKGFAPPVSTKP